MLFALLAFAASLAVSTGSAASSKTVTGVVASEFNKGNITQANRDSYLKTYYDAVTTWKSLSGVRKSELGNVIGKTQQFARSGKLGRNPVKVSRE